MGAREHFLDQLEQRQAALPGTQLPWLRRARGAARRRFAELGLPTTRDEDWKYTRLTHLDAQPLELAGPARITPEAALLAPHLIAGCDRLVFVDGRLAPALSCLEAHAEDVVIEGLANALDTVPMRCAHWLRADADGVAHADGFTALAAAAWTDGAFIDLPAGHGLARPLQLLFVTTLSDATLCTRNRIRLGAGARARIVEHHVGLGTGACLNDTLTEIELADGAHLDHVKLQAEGPRATHIAALRVDQAAGSRLASTSIALGARLSRTGIATRLGGEGAQAGLNGLYLADGRRHVDHHTLVDHASPGATSRERYKGIVDGGGRAVFNGRVIVRADAQGSDAAQANHNLLLSEHAEVDTKPQLEIWADDVKCSHGATVGQLDADALHYLRSRGIGATAARALLIEAFAGDIVAGLEPPALRAHVDACVRERLPGAGGSS
ncbi:Fe-S cluster assembly protein SufD [Nitrogeniibacter mangrovi]|uniref:Fe-S cluster assembly protein SufD n=1 Tax=Nitrogeniibacter mangrovi TaxID=2016596 RepID=A0A6C1AXT1_9RHOO|nr:Fe-S cluster assembly protein SufD [Nitrogeniibacter mangrovi]QID16162.1 Fe-S cluster assembly protein SufD [Nitrogeniibacter mangrovi]